MIAPRESGAGRPSRREFIALGIGAFVVAALPRAARPPRRLVRRTQPVMGTLAEIGVVARDRRWGHRAIDAAMAELSRVEREMSRYRADSDVGRANAAAAGSAVAVGAETAAVVAAGLRWAEASGGRFDPALARATALWDVERRHAPPAADRVRRYAARDLWRFVEVGRHGGHPVVLRREADAALDLGGIAKGYGVDRAVAALRDWGVTSGLVNVGGDLYALGASEDGDPWEVGIQDPLRPERIGATLRVEDRAVATSGDYERYFEWRGRRFHHLLDPRTGAPRATSIHAVTVLADDVMTADAAGTALFGLGPAEAGRLLAAAAPGAEARWIGEPEGGIS